MDDLSVGRSVQCIVEKTADRIRMPFGTVGRTGPEMRQVVGFGDRSTGRVLLGQIWGVLLSTGTYRVYGCYSPWCGPLAKLLWADLLSPHADRHFGDILFTVFCVSVSRSVRRISVTDISGVGGRRVIKFCKVVDLEVHQVISPFGELWPRG